MPFKHTGFITALITVLYTGLAWSADLYQYAMYVTPDSSNDKCELKERYTSVYRRPESIPGNRSAAGCWVSIPKHLYESRYQFCYFSGINLHNIQPGQSSECLIQERDNDYSFAAYIGQNAVKDSQVLCYFTCVGNAEK